MPIKRLFKNKILPLSKKILDLLDSDIAEIAMEGFLAKTSLAIRKVIRDVLRIPFNKSRGRFNMDPKKRERLDRLSHALTRMRNLHDVVSHIEKLRELHARDENQNRNNAISMVEESLKELLSFLDDDVIDRTFGGRDIDNIRNLLNDPDDHLESVLEWIKNTIHQSEIELAGDNEDKYNKMIQDLYNEDPKRCMRWHICASPTPSCPLSMSDVVSFYNDEWSAQKDFVPPDEGSLFDLTAGLVDEDRDVLLDAIQSDNLIDDVIKSRPYLSSHGLDGISYAIYKLDTNSARDVVSILMKFMLKTGKCPKVWRRSKSILLYKKGDPNELRSWRPISISSTLYRIVFCCFSRAIQKVARECDIISKCQKGFIPSINGAAEHIASLNELIHNAVRTK